MIYLSKVTQKYKGVTIAHYLSHRFTYKTIEVWLELLKKGCILVNGDICSSETLVSQGDEVTCNLEDAPLPADVNFDYSIIYEDEHLLAINKPSNLLVHDKHKYSQANLIYHIRSRHQPPYPTASLVNRIDKNTSGVILLGRDPDTLSKMNKIFLDKLVQKEYLALVSGVPAKSEGTVDFPIAKIACTPGMYRYGVDLKNGKEALTRYQMVESYAGKFSLLKLWPHTGRTHQLRVHCKAMGHTIVADKLYNLTDEEYLARTTKKKCLHNELIDRQALHCHSVTFVHPHTEETCRIEAPLPGDFKSLLNKVSALGNEVLQ